MRLGLARAHWINVALVSALVPLLATRAAAQEPEPKPLVVHAELSITRLSLPNHDTTIVNSGIGFDVAGVFEVRDRWHLALGFQHASHETSQSAYGAGRVSALQLFAEPRFILRIVGPALPYVSVRVGYQHLAQPHVTYLDDELRPYTGYATQTGLALGGGAGVLVTATKRLQGYAAAGVQYVSFGDIDLDGYHVGDSKVTGISVFMRAGVSLNFGPDGNVRR